MLIALIVLAYLLGSLSSAIITCRLMGLPDPREEGSGNPGATNVLRIGGQRAAAITLAGDTLKGVIPTLLARSLGVDDIGVALVGFAAFIGHLLPIFFGFRGGKGVATAFGVLLAAAPLVAGLCLLTWLVVAKVFRISSLAALMAAVLAPLFMWAVDGMGPLFGLAGVLSVVLLWRHRENIRRLRRGAEGQLGGP